MKKWLYSLILLSVLISGCAGTQQAQPSEREGAREACIQACQDALDQGKDLSNGPCLLDPMENQNWVCDVAHDPRQPVDNRRENQCDAWHAGTAEHFVEVTPDCEFIQVG